jgi:hypothetical protein
MKEGVSSVEEKIEEGDNLQRPRQLGSLWSEKKTRRWRDRRVTDLLQPAQLSPANLKSGQKSSLFFLIFQKSTASISKIFRN